MTNMYALTKAYEEVQALAEAGEDVTDTLLSLEGDIETKVEATNHIIKTFTGYNAAIDAELERLTKLKKANTAVVDRLENGIANVMKVLNLREIKTALFSAKWVKNPPKVIIDDEKKVPAKYLTIVPMEFVVQKKELAKFLKTGAKVTYAHLEQGRRLDLK